MTAVAARSAVPDATAALGLGALASVAVQAAALAMPLLTMHVFDGVLEERNADTLVVLGLAYVLALALGAVLRHQRASLLAALAERMGRRLQLAALAAAVRSALGGDTARGTAALQDVAEVRRLVGGSLATDLMDLLSIPAALLFLWLLHPLFLAVALAACAAQCALGAIADRTTRGPVTRSGAAAARSAAELTGRLRQQDALLGLGMLPSVLRRWAPTHLVAIERQDATQRRARALQGLVQLVGLIEQMAVVLAGAALLTRQETTPGGMMAATMLLSFATGPVALLTAHWRDWAFGAASWRRLGALVRDTAAPAPLPSESHAPSGLAIHGLTLRPPNATRPVLCNLSLQVAPGEALGVVGANGTGKTTLLRAVLGLAAPIEGHVSLDGQDTHRAERGAIGPHIGYLPQEAQLLRGSVVENIARFGGGPAAAAVEAAREAGAHEAIGRLHQGYDTPAGPDGGLSGGQQRLVALARALHGAPRLLVLDEPEAGLDAPALARLRAAVTSAKARGAVVLLVTHQPDHWDGVLDRCLHLLGAGQWRVQGAAGIPQAGIA